MWARTFATGFSIYLSWNSLIGIYECFGVDRTLFSPKMLVIIFETPLLGLNISVFANLFTIESSLITPFLSNTTFKKPAY